ncbi:Guanine deaminase-like protein [Pleurostoma richardsiae]|uniref:Guanine deaminase-like protein n=1 Tax=Pleurostoma richardsiae TaxID=41990 RepID=A0AA38VRT6_9PEZI|nr:Guanine deaminase-like protein [Pleurostoma richardsiae]
MGRTRVIFGGVVAHCIGVAAGEFQLLTETAIGIDESGKIVFVESLAADAAEAARKYGLDSAELITLKHTDVLIPGLVDTHTHAPQWENRGIGMDLPLLKWIDKYTRPTEMTFASTNKADRVYDMVVRDTLRNGTTTVCYYGTIHLESTKVLADKCFKYGQRGFIGQPSMDKSGYKEYCNHSPEDAVQRTKELIKYIRTFDPEVSVVTPIVTPGFAPVLSAESMRQLAQLAAAEDLPMQTHLSENTEEIQEMHRLFPSSPSYTHTLDVNGVLTSRTVLGHCVHLSDEERLLIAARGSGVSHCPSSNLNLSSGECRVRQLLDAGIKVGLGCDCSGGHSASVLENLRRASDVSRTLVATEGPRAQLEIHELLYLATLGGADVCGIADRVGSFEVGKEFDAILINPLAGLATGAGSIRLKEVETPMDIFQKVLFCCDDRHIRKVFVKGRVCVDKEAEAKQD